MAPLVDRMKQQVLASKVMQTGDTPVNVLDPSLPRTKTVRIFTYVGDRDHPHTVYDYTPTRSRNGPDRFMTEFHGYLQSDAYSGYDELDRGRGRKITEVACWAHARRRFFEAPSSDLMHSMVVLAYVRLLYDVEREARTMGLAGQERKALRQTRSLPIHADIKAYLEREEPAVLPKSREGAAISCTLSNREALVRYCDDGDLEIDNNLGLCRERHKPGNADFRIIPRDPVSMA